MRKHTNPTDQLTADAPSCLFNRVYNKECLCSLKGLRICYAYVPVHLTMSAFLYALHCFLRCLHQCICQGSAFPCILLYSFITCTSACLEVGLVSLCNQCSSVVHMCMDPLCICCSEVLPLSIASGLFSSPHPWPTIPFFYCILYQCDRCPSSLLGGVSWLGYHDLPAIGAVSSRSWLPTVEAPGCLGHSTSI